MSKTVNGDMHIDAQGLILGMEWISEWFLQKCCQSRPHKGFRLGGGEDVSISYFKQRGKKAQPGQESKW